MNELDEFMPPHSIDSEQAVLAMIIKSSTLLDESGLDENDFYRHDHKLIFTAIQHCVEAHGDVDVLMIAERLDVAGNLEKAGGLPHLVDLMQSAPSGANFKFHAKKIIDKSSERKLIAASNEVSQIVFGAGDYADKLAQSQSVLMGIENTQSISEAISIKSAFTQMIEKLDRVSAGEEKLTKTGFIDLDEKIIGLGNGDMIVIAGRPSMGKTALAMQIADHVASSIPVLIFSLEMSAEQIAQRQAASIGKIDLQSMRSGKMVDEDWQKLTYALGKAIHRQLFIDDRSGISMHQIRSRARQVKRKHGLGLVVIDYIGLIHGKGENRVNVVSEISREIKNMARELGVPVIALSQLNRGLASRTDKRPLMSDLRDSGSIEQDADVVILLHRDEYYNANSDYKGMAECIIAKQRNGPTGTVPLSFISEYAQFGNYAGHYQAQTSSPKGRSGFSYE